MTLLTNSASKDLQTFLDIIIKYVTEVGFSLMSQKLNPKATDKNNQPKLFLS